MSPGQKRQDDQIRLKFSVDWRLDPEADAKFDAEYEAWMAAEEYTTRAIGYTFNGLHVTESTRLVGGRLTLRDSLPFSIRFNAVICFLADFLISRR